MKLQEFVSETLKEIIAGVEEAQTYARDNGAMVNPEVNHWGDEEKYATVRLGPESWARVPIKDVEFDVAVTSTDAKESQAGAGIFVAALGMGVKDRSDTLNSCVSRIRFSVPLHFPYQSMVELKNG